jgi:hypothetical protein
VSACAREPSHPDAISFVPIVNVRTKSHHVAHNLMTWDDGTPSHRQVSLTQLKIRPADCACGGPENELPRFGSPFGGFHALERVT